jgi:large subunit ribosomal protein L15
MNLHTLKPAKGSRTSRKRVGRGPGSGLGTTAGRGNKGHQARSGYSAKNSEGGQMPIYRQLPKFGFTNPSRKEYRVFNVEQLETHVKKGLLTATITIDSLYQAGVIGKTDYVKILGNGELTTKLSVMVHAVTETAKEKIEKAGGTIMIAERTLFEASKMKTLEQDKALMTPKRDVNEYKKAIKAAKKAAKLKSAAKK